MNIAFSKLLSSIYLGFEMLRFWLRGLFNDRLIRYLSLILIVLDLGVWTLAIILARSIGSALAVLHYNVVFGIDKVGDAAMIYFNPAACFIIMLINLIFAAFCLSKRERAAAIILLSIALLFHFFTLISLYFSYLANFS